MFAYETNQTALFLPLRRFQLALLALTRVSGKEALNAWENNHEFMFGHDHGAWIGDGETPFGENHHIEVLAGLTFLSNGSMATDEQPNSRWLCRSSWRHAGHAKRAPRARHLQLRRLIVVSWLRCLLSASGPKSTGRARVIHGRRPQCPSRKMTVS